MKKSTLIIGFALTVSLLTSMFVFREIPVLSPWKNWKVLSVSIDIPESKVITDLSNIAINNVVTESSPKLQINSNFAPVLPSEYNFYKDNLYRFFYDKEHKFRLYYLPKDVSNKTLKALDFDYNVDLQSSFPYFGLIITVIVYIIQLFLIKNKFLFAISLLPCIVFSITFPNYNSLIINLFIFIIIYFLDKYHERKNILLAFFKNYFILLSLSLCIITCILSGIKCICFFVLTILSIFILYKITSHLIEYLYNKKNTFNYVKIVNSKNLKFCSNEIIYFLYGTAFFILLGALSFFLIPSVTNKTVDNTPLSIPIPLEYNGTRGFSLSSYTNLQTKKSPTEFPDLGDFVSQIWNATVFAYVPLKENKGYVANVPQEASVKTTEYFVDNGVIKTKSVEVARFTNQFIDTTLEQIKTCNNPVIEKVLMDQESFCAADFGNVKRTNSFTFVIFVIALLFCGAQIFVFFKFYKLGC